LTISGGIGPIQSQDKTAKKRDGELVHHGLDAAIRVSRSLGQIVKILTCQLVSFQRKSPQIREFDDFGRNRPYTKSRQSSEKREMGESCFE
jgi:hypothetical protein